MTMDQSSELRQIQKIFSVGFVSAISLVCIDWFSSGSQEHTELHTGVVFLLVCLKLQCAAVILYCCLRAVEFWCFLQHTLRWFRAKCAVTSRQVFIMASSPVKVVR